jgi:hypothetical protein
LLQTASSSLDLFLSPLGLVSTTLPILNVSEVYRPLFSLRVPVALFQAVAPFLGVLFLLEPHALVAPFLSRLLSLFFPAPSV